tara:strand:+ start:2491 stop:2796 length:306 start_codon:yes stop_codon:yes gene_type:complete
MDSQLNENPVPTQPKLTAEQIQQMKDFAKQQAIQQVMAQRQATQQQQRIEKPSPQVVYVRRNLTLAELITVFIISCGLVFGLQVGWNYASNVLPRIEVKVN